MKHSKKRKILTFLLALGVGSHAQTINNISVSTFETDDIITVQGVLPTYDSNMNYLAKEHSGSHGKLHVQVDGSWKYISSTPMNELGDGDSILETFDVIDSKNNNSKINITINGREETKKVFTKAEDSMLDQSLDELMNMEAELKADVGSRDGARDHLRSNAPVDIITAKEIEKSGHTKLIDVLRYFVPGFNSPVPSVADGSDHVNAYTLRGMTSDQILVLVNGKRLHSSSLLHVNGTIGRGASHADLNTIPVRAIEKVEILRDGAAAQYGSDAISGVINIILRGMGQKNIVSMHGGKRKKGDGLQRQADAFISLPLQYDGFVNVSVDVNDQKQTQRAGLDQRVSPAAVTTHAGIADSRNYKASLYAEIPQKKGFNIYSQMLLSQRQSEASAFFRPASTNSAGIYPNGFLPMLKADIFDYSFALGAKGEIGNDFSWDLSNVHGKNKIDYSMRNTMNYALGSTSPTTFDNGGLSFTQNTTTFEIKNDHEVFQIAAGLEYRYENYAIRAGEYNSYYNGGSQGFSGYMVENATDQSRNSYALYFDTTYDFTKKFDLEVSLRYEDYEDFGESTNGKIALLYDVNDIVLLRSSLSTGFRAPSLAQSHYSQTSTYVDGNNNLTTQGTFKNSHPVAQSLGAKELRSERSQHIGLGTIITPNKNNTFMFDVYRIDVTEKIILTPELTATTTQQQSVFATYGVGAARFFANAASTVTQGFDFKYSYKHKFTENSEADFSLWAHYNKNEITAKGSHAHVQQSQTIKTMIEDGQPKRSLKLLTNYKYKRLHTALNVNRFGEYKQYQNSQKYSFGPSWTVDADISYKFANNLSVAVGGVNIFDEYPQKWDNLVGDYYGTNNTKMYSRYAPYGYSGAYYYIRATIDF